MIVREGLVLVTASALAVGLAMVQGSLVLAGGLALLCGYLAFVFSEPRPSVPSLPAAVVSPAAGHVSFAGKHRDPWLDREVLRIEVCLAKPGVIAMLSPIEGQVMNFWAKSGPFGDAGGRDDAGQGGSPDCYAIWLQTDEGDDVVLSVSSRFPISRCRFRAAPGERIGHGQVAGFVYFASSIDVLMSTRSRLLVNVGDRVGCGESVLAELVHD